MKRISALIFSFLLTGTIYSQGIEFFQGTWKEAVEIAKQENKIVFVDSYATWCGPCKIMAKNVFTKPEVGEFFNKNFINLKLDMEKSDGMTFGQKYPVSAYPTLFFLDGKGNIVKKITGGQSVERLLELARTAIKSHDTTGDFEVDYQAGNRDYDLVYNYIIALNRIGKPSLKISNEYLNSNPDISPEQKGAFLLEALVDADSKIFDELINFKSEAIKSNNEEVFKDKVRRAAFKTIKKAVDFEYKDLLSVAIEKYKLAGLDDYDKFVLEAHLEYYKLYGSYPEWKQTSQKFLKKYGKKENALYAYHIAILRNSFNFENDALDYACQIGKEMIKRSDTGSNYSYYIQLLVTAKNYEEALKITNEAIKKLESRGEDISFYNRMKEHLNSF